MPAAKVVTELFGIEHIQDIDVYMRHGGYEAARRALKEMDPPAVQKIVADSGLRGRGGAYAGTGMKWGLMAKGTPHPNYLICNSDESEPCTFSDRWKMKSNPHQMIEGMIITAYAIQAHLAFIYMRGEFRDCQRQVEKALAEAYEKGLLGKDILGTGFDLEIYVHMGAGAYICGEESALIESLEGKRGFPRIKPPYFPAAIGLYRAPTIVNNCETFMNLPPILTKGADWFKTMGTERCPGTRVFGVGGHVNRPGCYELEMGTTLREVVEEHGGGLRNGKKFKAAVPGGCSSGLIPADNYDQKMDPESLSAVGCILGTGAVTVMDETTCMVRVAWRFEEFCREESCGQCTPCRDGTDWLVKVLHRIEHGEGQLNDIPTLLDLAFNICTMPSAKAPPFLRTVCGMGLTDVACINHAIQYFRDEFEDHIAQRRCPFPGL